MAFRDRDEIYDSRTLAGDARLAIGTFSSRVYGWLAIGLGVTAATAYLLFHSGLFVKLLPFWWVLSLATLGVALGFNAAVQRFTLVGVVGMFVTYAVLQGLVFGTLLPAFAAAFGGQVIWLAFITAASLFLLAMAYGIFTKNDLTTLGRILSFALIGLAVTTLLFMILSLFIQMQFMHLLISYIGLIIFVGLTAYDAQTIRSLSLQADIRSVASYKLSMVMALKMYINVIMIFWYLLRIFSSGRR